MSVVSVVSVRESMCVCMCDAMFRASALKPRPRQPKLNMWNGRFGSQIHYAGGFQIWGFSVRLLALQGLRG